MSETQLVQRLGAEHSAEAIHMMQNGDALLEECPESFEVFMHAAALLTRSRCDQRQNYDLIGEGGFSHVYALPGYEDMCLKVVSLGTRRVAHSRSAIDAVSLPNLNTESRFMDRVGRHLGRQPETRVRAPLQYATARFNGGSASLQERIPQEFVSIRDLIEETGTVTDEMQRQAQIAYQRAKAALDGSALRLGVGDMLGDGNGINVGNFMVDRHDLANGDLYVIDLIGRSRFRRASAAILSKLA